MHKFGKVIFGLNMTSQYDSICIMIYNSIYIETFFFSPTVFIDFSHYQLYFKQMPSSQENQITLLIKTIYGSRMVLWVF